MLIVGLTGGIGSGKSTAARFFAARGVPVIDTDTIAREAVEPGTPALARIAEEFGPAVLTPAGTLDRAALRARVFADAEQRRRLEAILHPEIRARARKRLADLAAPYAIVVVPLLLESGEWSFVQRVLVVDVPESVQRERACARDGLSRAQVDAVMSAQVGRERRLAAADDVLVNDRDLPTLERRVEALHRRYLQLARACAAHPGTADRPG
ncbi:MAG TPA: dephospho-CoA kinase [Gammaproteobacteria bacterium]|nr:dephospho-CoA kinase [bacterium BMS3Abin12]HDK03523.1 dephospho-CoA kinase [Gammaproteobacteria bacterium]